MFEILGLLFTFFIGIFITVIGCFGYAIESMNPEIAPQVRFPISLIFIGIFIMIISITAFFW